MVTETEFVTVWDDCARGLDTSTRRLVTRDYTRYLLFKDGSAWLSSARPRQLEVGCTACPTRHRSAGLDCIPSLKWPRCTTTPRGKLQGFDPVRPTAVEVRPLLTRTGIAQAIIQFLGGRRGGGTTKVNVVVNPIAPSHPIVISCINGGYVLNQRVGDDAEARMANFIVPPFAPVFTQRNPDNPNAIVAAANVNYMNDDDWKFLGVAFTGCTLHQARSLSLADPDKAKSFRIAVIVGGSCTVAAGHNAENLGVTDPIRFLCENKAQLEAPDVPLEKYRQSYPTRWQLSDEHKSVEDTDGAFADDEFIETEGKTSTTTYTIQDKPKRLAGIVLDVGVAKDLRILLK